MTSKCSPIFFMVVYRKHLLFGTLLYKSDAVIYLLLGSWLSTRIKSISLFAVGYHNGGLSLKDRNLVESLFLSGDVKILCTTNTLAHGINLPAHTVVIKSTQHLYVDLSFLPPVNWNWKTFVIYQKCILYQQQRERPLHGIRSVHSTTGLSTVWIHIS